MAVLLAGFGNASPVPNVGIVATVVVAAAAVVTGAS